MERLKVWCHRKGEPLMFTGKTLPHKQQNNWKILYSITQYLIVFTVIIFIG